MWLLAVKPLIRFNMRRALLLVVLSWAGARTVLMAKPVQKAPLVPLESGTRGASAAMVTLSAREIVSWTCVFTASQTSMEPVKEFTDRDTIYAHIALTGLLPGVHVLEGEWFRPKGLRQALAKVPFASKKGDKQYLFAWLKFEVPVRPFDFLMAEEREVWRLKMSVDGKVLGEKEFIVWR